MSLKHWLDEIAILGWQRNFRAFGYYFGVCLWPDQPPCKGKLFGCWHIEGEPGYENYEASFPLTKNWTVHLNAGKEPK